MAPNQDQSSQKRTWTAVIQGLCGLMAIACGIALIPLKSDGRYTDYYVVRPSNIIANVGFGIWGGVIITVTAIMGCVYRDKKAMISIYAAFSLVSMTVAVMLFFVGITGVANFASLNNHRCSYASYNSYDYYYHDYTGFDADIRCCFHRYSCDYTNWRDYSWSSAVRETDPFNDYNSAECRREREEQCRETVRKIKSANLSVFAILLIVSVVEFTVSITAAVFSFIFVCRGCCKEPPQQMVYLAYPPNGQNGSVPMVVVPNMVQGSTFPQMTGVAPNTMASPYPLAMAAINPNMAPTHAVNQGFGPGMPTGTNNAMAAGAWQWQAAPPPQYETIAGNI